MKIYFVISKTKRGPACAGGELYPLFIFKGVNMYKYDTLYLYV